MWVMVLEANWHDTGKRTRRDRDTDPPHLHSMCWKAADAMVEWLLDQDDMENVRSINPGFG
ncbi:MAG: hypothetical protein CM1200mP14_21290 [Gammaproteobacteria bacterium]|nr:MAG: hypothetical protein CM1200mP14_21290 [Gammaproteobacteria bacterium]